MWRAGVEFKRVTRITIDGCRDPICSSQTPAPQRHPNFYKPFKVLGACNNFLATNASACMIVEVRPFSLGCRGMSSCYAVADQQTTGECPSCGIVRTSQRRIARVAVMLRSDPPQSRGDHRLMVTMNTPRQPNARPSTTPFLGQSYNVDALKAPSSSFLTPFSPGPGGAGNCRQYHR